MIQKLIFLALFAPSIACAAEQSLLPAICQQVLTPNPETSVSKVIIDHFVERAKEVPSKMQSDAEQAGDKFALALSDTLEQMKKSPDSKLSSGNAAAGVLGAHTQLGWFDRAYDEAINIIQTLLKHWVYTMAGIGALVAYFLFKF